MTDATTTLTRAEVDRLSDLAATRLHALGATPGSIVAMTGPNTAQLLVLTFAVWKIGASPLPLHARKGSHELSLLLRLAQPAVAVDFDPDVNLRLDPATATTTLEALCQPGDPGRIPPLDAPCTSESVRQAGAPDLRS